MANQTAATQTFDQTNHASPFLHSASPLHFHGLNTDKHIVYRPRQTALTHQQADVTSKHHVDLVRVTFVDAANIPRCRLIPLPSFLKTCVHKGQAFCSAVGGFTCVMDVPAPNSGLTTTGDVQMMPDLATFRLLGIHPGHAHVLCDMVNRETGEPWEHCPRGFLKKQLAKLRDEFKLELVAGFESEFYLKEDGKETDTTIYAENRALWTRGGKVFDDILRNLIKSGIEIENSHAESGNGQFEIATAPLLALDAVDGLIYAREVINEVAASHGLTATFSPKPYPSQAGNGQHVHLSFNEAGKNVFPEGEAISERGKHFMAGVLEHLPAICGVTMPSLGSYKRVQPHCWSGAFTCWGMNNREAPLRVPSSSGSSNFEVKCIDASSNPYLALGVLLAAGMDGLANKLDLSESVQGDPADLDDSEKERLGVKLLPTSLDVSLGNLERDVVLCDALGASLVQSFIATRRYEQELLQDKTDEEVAKLLSLRY